MGRDCVKPPIGCPPQSNKPPWCPGTHRYDIAYTPVKQYNDIYIGIIYTIVTVSASYSDPKTRNAADLDQLEF